MLKVIALVIYLLSEDRKLILKDERRTFENEKACSEHVLKRVKDVSSDPRFVEGVIAACVPVHVTEA